MLLDRLPADLHERLCNWGRVMRVRPKQGTSITGEICAALALRAGKGVHGDEHGERPPPANPLDAELIEAVWFASTYRMTPKRRGLLRAHYVIGQHRNTTCRLLIIAAREYENEVVAAVNDFDRVLSLHNKRVACLTRPTA